MTEDAEVELKWSTRFRGSLCIDDLEMRYDQILGMGRGEEGQAALLLVVSMIPSMKRLPASTWGMS